MPIEPPDPLNLARFFQHFLVFIGLGTAVLPRALQRPRRRYRKP
ncbi:hypothetical protein [Sorangium atrum]|uniref:Uncharacterized protein n=1 Tax=Sorangium atrum TaxID=2995308 RepID=A0ABT5C9K2_9BACT|nr:hypothetical protein [Sorangium aterium]MDC0683117.1 hypothetical protein [Sorangium aterium]